MFGQISVDFEWKIINDSCAIQRPLRCPLITLEVGTAFKNISGNQLQMEHSELLIFQDHLWQARYSFLPYYQVR